MLIDAGLLGSIFMALCAVCIIVKILRISQIMTLIVYDYSFFLQHCTKNFSDKCGKVPLVRCLKDCSETRN